MINVKKIIFAICLSIGMLIGCEKEIKNKINMENTKWESVGDGKTILLTFKGESSCILSEKDEKGNGFELALNYEILEDEIKFSRHKSLEFVGKINGGLLLLSCAYDNDFNYSLTKIQ